MKRKTLLKIISTIFLLTFTLSIFLSILPNKTVANTDISSLYANPNQNNSPFKFKIESVVNSNMMMQVVGCTGVVNRVSEWMSKILLSKKAKEQIKEAEDAATKEMKRRLCNTLKSSSLFTAGTIPLVNNMTDGTKAILDDFCLDKIESEDQTSAALKIKQLKKEEEKQRQEQCFNGIAITLAKNQLTSMTRSMMNWVNTGYGGNPLFVQNFGNLMGNIERNVLETGIDILLSPENANPYARNFANSTINNYRSNQGVGSGAINFLGGLKSDLSYFISDPKSYYTNEQLNKAEDTRTALQIAQEANDRFANDFSVGGWEGYLALTQRDQNNPLGFTMLASQRLADEQAFRKKEVEQQLTQNSGFLSQKKCILWAPYDANGKRKMVPSAGAGSMLKYSDYVKEKSSEFDKCIKWETITPGSLIKDKTSEYLNSPERQLELAKTINDSLNALFSVLLSKLSSSGLRGLSDASVNPTNWTDSLNSLNSYGYGENNNPNSLYNNKGAYSNFNLTRDLGNTFIYDKYHYLGDWDAQKNETTSSNVVRNEQKLFPGLTPELYDQSNNQITSNIYYVVKTAGNTVLNNNIYNHWEVNDRAFWDGKEWQNWKCGALNDKGECTKQSHPIKTRGVIQIQKDYIVALKELIKIIPIIPKKIGELDYCLPGPNPNYRINSMPAQSAYNSWISSMYVGPRDEKRVEWRIDDKYSRTFTTLKNIYKDNPRVWSELNKHVMINYFCDDWAESKWGDCKSYHHNPNDNQVDNIDNKKRIMEIVKNYTFGELFQTFFEVTDKMMNKLYFKNMTKKYIEKEDEEFSLNNLNPSYIEMAESGLELTRNLVDYDKDVQKSLLDYNDAMEQVSIAINKLEPIKAEVSAIIKKAQERRDKYLLEKINEQIEKECSIEKEKCIASNNLNTEGTNGLCLSKYNICLKKTMAVADYKIKYSQCFNEEDIKFYNEYEIMGTGSKIERCNNKIDDDGDGLVDGDDPDCQVIIPPGTGGGIVIPPGGGGGGYTSGLCSINYNISPINAPQMQSESCNIRQTQTECLEDLYYHLNQGWVCQWSESGGGSGGGGGGGSGGDLNEI
jgi:hypothetical protein